MKRLKLTLRDFFWLILASALAIGWWADQSRITARVVELEEQKQSYSQLMKDVVVAEQRCEQILQEWADLKARDSGQMNPPLPPRLRRTVKDEI